MLSAVSNSQFFNEMMQGDEVRAPYRSLFGSLKSMTAEQIRHKLLEAESIFRQTGITFAVYGDEPDTERLIPFDIIPRIFTASEWGYLERGG